MTRRSAGMVERAPECEVEISQEDASRLGAQDGAMVRVQSRRGEITARLSVADRAVPGTIFVPFHYAEAAVNLLTHGNLDPISKIPGYKVCAVRLMPL